MPELFLDANAHLPLSKPALDAFLKCNGSLAGHGHPMSPAGPGRAAEAAIEESRIKIANFLGAKFASQIVFTSTCTQACEWGLDIFSNINYNKQIYISPAEHPAVRQKATKIFKYSMLETNKDGVIDKNYPVNPNSGLICIYVQNETGCVQPIDKIKVHSIFSDMSQAPGKYIIPKLNDFNNLDVAAFGAHKFGGPTGVGFYYIRDISKWEAFDAGSRYFMDRAGSPDVSGIVATAAALEYALNSMPERVNNMYEFGSIIEPALEEMGFEIIGKDSIRVPNTSFVRVPSKYHAQILLLKLGKKGIYVGLGSACGSTNTGTSPLMQILSRSGDNGNYLRISNFGEYKKSDAEYFVKSMKEILK